MDQRKFAKHLRTTMTEAEHRLWFHLRAHRFIGCKFRRQQPLGPYILDFVSFSERVVIEADGGQHNASEADRGRDAWLAKEGFRVLRFWNHDILQNTPVVLDAIWSALRAAPSPPAPLPQGERGEMLSPLPQGGEGRNAEPSPPARLPQEGRGEKLSPSPLVGEGLGRGEPHFTDE